MSVNAPRNRRLLIFLLITSPGMKMIVSGVVLFSASKMLEPNLLLLVTHLVVEESFYFDLFTSPGLKMIDVVFIFYI